MGNNLTSRMKNCNFHDSIISSGKLQLGIKVKEFPKFRWQAFKAV